MRSLPRICRLAFLALALVIAAPAGALAAHYVPGALGVNASIIPPPGFHYIMYNMFYSADDMMDRNGNSRDLGFDVNVYANVSQFCYITDYKILGADFGVCLFVPFVYTDIQMDKLGMGDNEFGLGDIDIEPFCLAWHYDNFDAVVALDLYMPTGDSGDLASPGLGYYSLMQTLGVNFYFDQAKTWTFSVLTRWLEHFESRDDDITRGMELVAEYGIGKTFVPKQGLFLRAGVAGYSDLQLDADDGPGADADERRRVHAVGPDFNITWLGPVPLQLETRYMFEYGAEDHSEGQTFTVTLRASF